MTTPTRAYHSQRTGKNTGTPKMTLEQARRTFKARFTGFENEGFFQEWFGKFCPDNRSPGRLGGDVEGAILLSLNKTDLWPVEIRCESYSEDDLFDMIEFLYDRCSKGVESWNHNYYGCGTHYTKFDSKAGQAEFRAAMNEFLAVYGSGYELSDKGEVLSKPEEGFEELMARPVASVDPKNFDAQVAAARRKFLSRHATPADRLDAIRDLAAALEFIRPQVEKVLKTKDAADLYQIANRFGIRHNRPDQQTDYDQAIFYEWMFYYYLATIHASVRLMEKEGMVAPAPPAEKPVDDIPF